LGRHNPTYQFISDNARGQQEIRRQKHFVAGGEAVVTTAARHTRHDDRGESPVPGNLRGEAHRRGRSEADVVANSMTAFATKPAIGFVGYGTEKGR
jgi:hypothetical protein